MSKTKRKVNAVRPDIDDYISRIETGMASKIFIFAYIFVNPRKHGGDIFVCPVLTSLSSRLLTI